MCIGTGKEMMYSCEHIFERDLHDHGCKIKISDVCGRSIGLWKAGAKGLERTILRNRRTKDETHTIVSPAFNAATLEIFEPLTNVPNAELRSRIYTLTLDL